MSIVFHIEAQNSNFIAVGRLKLIVMLEKHHLWLLLYFHFICFLHLQLLAFQCLAGIIRYVFQLCFCCYSIWFPFQVRLCLMCNETCFNAHSHIMSRHLQLHGGLFYCSSPNCCQLGRTLGNAVEHHVEFHIQINYCCPFCAARYSNPSEIRDHYCCQVGSKNNKGT